MYPPLATPSPSTYMLLCSLSLSHTHTHANACTHTYDFVLIFNCATSTLFFIPVGGPCTRKVALRIVVPNKGPETLLIVCVSGHPMFPRPSGYNIKVAMRAIENIFIPCSVQLNINYTGSNWKIYFTSCSDRLTSKREQAS